MIGIKDKIRGSLIGGAVGDALGYPVEFMKYDGIIDKFGENGLQEYVISKNEGEAVFSDDTQMTLFTAVGLLNCFTKNTVLGTENTPEAEIYESYLDWYDCQYGNKNKKPSTWLSSIGKIRVPRAPGITCLNSLGSGKMGSVSNPLNKSKGCGGVMRVAPIGLFYDHDIDIEYIMKIGAEAAAITHGHSLGYMPSAALVQIIHRLVYGGCTEGDSLESIIAESNRLVSKLYGTHKHLNYYLNLIEKAVELSKNELSDVENIESIGGGWVAEEALAIALYCSLKYRDDFDSAIIASVNHGGDSDSTGSITGNIVGAIAGYEKISSKWKEKLEMTDLILEISDDIFEKYSDSKSWHDKYFKYK